MVAKDREEAIMETSELAGLPMNVPEVDLSNTEWYNAMRDVINAIGYVTFSEDICEERRKIIDRRDAEALWNFVNEYNSPVIRCSLLCLNVPYELLLEILNRQEELAIPTTEVIACFDQCFEECVNKHPDDAQMSNFLRTLVKAATLKVPEHVIGQWVFHKTFHQPVKDEHQYYNQSLSELRIAAAECARGKELPIDKEDYYQLIFVLFTIFNNYDDSLYPLQKLEKVRDAFYHVMDKEHYYPSITLRNECLGELEYLFSLFNSITPEPLDMIKKVVGWNRLAIYEGWAHTPQAELFKRQRQESFLIGVLLMGLIRPCFCKDETELLEYFTQLNHILFNQLSAADFDFTYKTTVQLECAVVNKFFKQGVDMFVESLLNNCKLDYISEVLGVAHITLSDKHKAQLQQMVNDEWPLTRELMLGRHQKHEVSNIEKTLKSLCSKIS